jgi:hypothetical protein
MASAERTHNPYNFLERMVRNIAGLAVATAVGVGLVESIAIPSSEAGRNLATAGIWGGLALAAARQSGH